ARPGFSPYRETVERVRWRGRRRAAMLTVAHHPALRPSVLSPDQERGYPPPAIPTGPKMLPPRLATTSRSSIPVRPPTATDRAVRGGPVEPRPDERVPRR